MIKILKRKDLTKGNEKLFSTRGFTHQIKQPITKLENLIFQIIANKQIVVIGQKIYENLDW